MKNILLTGDKGIGKTTIINNVLNRFQTFCDLNLGGFCTLRNIYNKDDKEIREFFIKSLSDNETKKVSENTIIDGKWYINSFLNEFNNFSYNLVKSVDNSDLIILDEIGFLEENAYDFVDALHLALSSDRLVLGIIRNKDCDFINSIKNRDDVLIINVGIDNRDILVDEIYNLICNHINDICYLTVG